jgi:hypothetical protein
MMNIMRKQTGDHGYRIVSFKPDSLNDRIRYFLDAHFLIFPN